MTRTVTIQAQQKWEYCCETHKTETRLLTSVNELGQHGWELVNTLYYKDIKGAMAWTAFLKRPSAGTTNASGQTGANSSQALHPPEKPSQPQGFDLSGDEFEIKKEQ